MRTTWIVIADGAKAQVYQYDGKNEPLEKVEGGTLSHVNKPSHELVTNKRGRVFQSADPSRSGMENPTDPHEHEKHVFAGEVADWLEERIGEYEQLILIAAPRVLGDLRRDLSDRVMAKVSAELDKDLTNVPVPELREHLQKVLPINKKVQHLSPKVKYAKG